MGRPVGGARWPPTRMSTVWHLPCNLMPLSLAALETLGLDARDRASEIDEARRLPADLAAGLAATGITRGFAPVEVGAPELPIGDYVDAVERLAYHEASLGWCAMISCTTSLVSGYVDERWLEPLFGSPEVTLAGFAGPMGQARPAEDGSGLVVSGRWPWGSGSYNANWIGGGIRVSPDHPITDSDGRQLRVPFVFFARDQVELLDTWHVTGLKGTGSTDYEVTGAVIPDGRWADMAYGPRIGRTLYRFPFFGALAVGVAAVSLGIARRSIDDFVELAAVKKPALSSRVLAERQVVQAEVAQAEAAWRSARAFLDQAVADAWLSTESGSIDNQAKAMLRLAATNATDRAAHAVSLCYHAAGGSSVYLDSPLQRHFRDVHVTTQHGMVAPRLNEVLGRFRLGLPTDFAAL